MYYFILTHTRTVSCLLFVNYLKILKVKKKKTNTVLTQEGCFPHERTRTAFVIYLYNYNMTCPQLQKENYAEAKIGKDLSL